MSTLKHLNALIDEQEALDAQLRQLYERDSFLREEIPRVRMTIAMNRKKPVEFCCQPTPPLRQYVGMSGMVTKVNQKSCLVDFEGTTVRVPSWQLRFFIEPKIQTAGQLVAEHSD